MREVDDRGVSDVVGFVLVFALVVVTVSIAFVGGFTGLEGARDAERVNNAERAFDVLAHNVDDMDRRGAPARATELKLADASLSFGAETNVTISVDGTSISETLSPVVYEFDGTRIVYENGAVIREEGSGAVLRRAPPVRFTDDGTRTAVLPIVDLNARSERTVAGQSTVLVRTELQDGGGARATLLSTPKTFGSPETVTLNVTTSAARAPVWKRYVEEEVTWGATCGAPTTVTTGTAVVCTFDVDRVLVRATYIDAALD